MHQNSDPLIYPCLSRIRSLATDLSRKFNREFDIIKDETFRLNETDVERKSNIDQLNNDIENVNLMRKESESKLKNEMSDMEERFLKKIEFLQNELRIERGKADDGLQSEGEGPGASTQGSINFTHDVNSPLANSTPKFTTPGAGLNKQGGENLAKQLGHMSVKSKIPRKSPVLSPPSTN